ncbi:DUF1566 domain-containing protein [Cysteiniphilum halobium]|uniref:Lcl C-terminal domain-containing protein n=1 Tax=Cysteiniphilum halobium TaxID=2219059 RepID=UPI003F84564B
MRKINKTLLLFSLLSSFCAWNDGFASTGVIIQNTNPTDTGPGQWPTPRFISAKKTDNSTCNDAEYDKLTGLMWAKDGSASRPIAWSDAVSYAKKLSLCGYNDWRLPTVNELRSLVNYADTTSPAHWLNANGFSGIQSDFYLSATIFSPKVNYVWVLSMAGGWIGPIDSVLGYVLPVRGPN